VSAIPLASLLGDLDPTRCKLHCAIFNGVDHPIDVMARDWNEWVGWSRYRGKQNVFNRDFIFTVAKLRNASDQWLFGGVFEVVKRRPTQGDGSYDIKQRDDFMGPYTRRLVVHFDPPGRAMRLNMENHLDQISVVSILEEPYVGELFPGLDKINHTFRVLEVAVRQPWHDWQGALQQMKGVYVIHDLQTGKPYVGSATGDTGIWSRLSYYVDSLHGGNKSLRELVGQEGDDYARDNLSFALLEFWSMRTADEHVLERESYWKNVLLSRKFGHNKN
jgi:hypothetical protein